MANVYLGQSALALVVELVLVGILLRSSGVTRSLALLPLVVLAGATGYAVGAGLVAMLILKTLDGGLRPSLYRVGTELLFLPIGPAERRVVKPSIDTLGQRGGRPWPRSSSSPCRSPRTRTGWPRRRSCLALVAVAWVQATGSSAAATSSVSSGSSARVGVSRVLGRLDLASAEVLVAGLGSSNVREVLAALEVLAGSERLGLVPALILYHPDPARCALGAPPPVDRVAAARRGRTASLPAPSPRRSGPRHGRGALGPRAGILADALLRVAPEDPSPKVRASALIALSASSTPAEMRGVARRPSRPVPDLAVPGGRWPGPSATLRGRICSR